MNYNRQKDFSLYFILIFLFQITPSPSVASQFIKQIFDKDQFKPQIAVILGSGLSGFADSAFNENTRKEINYSDVPQFPTVGVLGHRGILYYGYIGDKSVIAFAGRFHCYEGFSCEETTFLPQLCYLLGAKVYILTNAAGCTDVKQSPGSLMTIVQNGLNVKRNVVNGLQNMCQQTDDINQIMKDNSYPLQIDSTKVYSKYLSDLANQISQQHDFQKYNINLYHGNYIFNLGPIYESTFDIQQQIKLAPGSVGMSSVPEADMAALLGLECYGLSLLTNMGAGLTNEVLNHEDVTIMANKVGEAVVQLVAQLIKQCDLSKCQQKQVVNMVGDFTFGDINIRKQFQVNKKVILVPYYKFDVKQQEETTIILVPNNLSIKSCLYLIGKIANSEQIIYLDNSLQDGKIYNDYEVLNRCEQVDQVDLCKALNIEQKLNKINNYKLVATTQIESIENNTFVQNFVKLVNADCATNKLSGCLLHMSSQLHLNIKICNYNTLKEVQFEQNSLNLTEQQIQKIQNIQYESFKDLIEQPTFEAATTYYHQKLDQNRKVTTKCICLIDSPTLTYTQVQELQNEFGNNILMILLPQNSYNQKLIVRSCKFANLPVIVCKIQNQSENQVITDIFNYAQFNILVGKNDERFGQRFTDLGCLTIQNLVEKLNYKKCTVVLENNIQINEVTLPDNINVCYNDQLNCLLMLKQMSIKFQGFVLNSLQSTKETLQKVIDLI